MPLKFWIGEISLMISYFSGEGLIPASEIKCHKYWSLGKLHLLFFSFRTASFEIPVLNVDDGFLDLGYILKYHNQK